MKTRFLSLVLFVVGIFGLIIFMNWYEQKDRVYLDSSYTTFHNQDTITMNGKRYLKIYDTRTYNDPRARESWLIEVNN